MNILSFSTPVFDINELSAQAYAACLLKDISACPPVMNIYDMLVDKG